MKSTLKAPAFPLSVNDALEIFYQNGFAIIDNFLPEKPFLALQQSILEQKIPALKKAFIGQAQSYQQLSAIRSDNIAWLDEINPRTHEEPYLLALSELATQLNQAFYLGLSNLESHYAVYEPGAFYRKHIDQFRHNQDRKISCVYYLNQNWQEKEGGQLCLYDNDENLLQAVFPIGNRMIFFRSDMLHEVCVTHRLRYSIASWLKNRP